MVRLRRILPFTLLLAACGSGVRAQILYTITRVQYVPGSASDASALNDSGLVVGGSGAANSATAGKWQNGVGSLLAGGSLGDQLTTAFAVNNAGQAVGVTNNQTAFSALNAVATDLGVPSDSAFAVAQGINDSGVIVGRSRITAAQNDQAFVYQNGAFTHLGYLSSNPADAISAATAINNNGLIVGYSRETVNNNPNNSWVRPVTFQNGVITNLTPGFIGNGQANAVNDSAQIVGTLNGNAMLWQNGGMTNLGAGEARGINNSGMIVGDNFNSSPFLYTGGTRYNLSSLITNLTGWVITRADDINASGQIVGSGRFNNENTGYILTPVPTATATPEPGTAALAAALALPGARFLRQRRKRARVLAEK